jgi:Tfp pilus assembly protein PilN
LIEINLLPSGGAQRRPAARRERAGGLPVPGADPRVAALAGAAVLIVALGAFGFWRQGAQRDRLTEQVERERADSVRLARTITLMRSLESRRDTIEQKMAVIRSVDGRRYVWPHLMDEISRAVPPYTWLTKVTAEASAAGPGGAPRPAGAAPAPAPAPASTTAPAAGDTTKKAAGDTGKVAIAPPPPPPGFSVEGAAATTQALTRFMKNLEASAFIRDVALVTSEQTVTEGRSYLKFTLEARWEQPDSTLVETVPVVPVH